MLTLRWQHWQHYHKLNHCALEMSEYFIIIAYSNNVYFFLFRGTLQWATPKNCSDLECQP